MIKFKVNFELKLTLLLILEFILLLSLLTSRDHNHCCSTQCVRKPLNRLSRSESTAKSRKLISSCQTLMLNAPSPDVMLPHMNWQRTMVHHMRRFLGLNFYNIGRLQLYSLFGTSLFIVIKYKKIEINYE